MFAMLTPWGLRNFRAYMAQFMIHNPVFDVSGLLASPAFLIASFVFGAALNGFILWLLHRHRNAFTQVPPPPPSLTPAQYEGVIG